VHVPVLVRLSVHSPVHSPAPIPALNQKIKIEEDPLQARIEITPGSLDLDIKSLEKAKDKEKEQEQEQMETHHHAFGLPSGWWEWTQFEVMPRPWKDGDVGGEEKVDGKDGIGKGRDVREPKRQGSLAIATSEQAEGWDVTRRVS